jgi:two-component system sensor histidine kinase KdpD
MRGVKVTASLRQAAAGAGLSLGLVVVLGAAMFPLRSHLSAATTALVLVVPVVLGVARGGFAAGVVATVCGFVVYDYVFLPPYYTLDVGAPQNWAALGVYAVVMVVVARVVSQVNRARADAQRRAAELRRLFDLSELLVREAAVPELLDTIVTSVVQAFDLEGAGLLLPVAGRLALVASCGTPPTEADLERLEATVPGPVSIGSGVLDRGGMQVVALAASGQAIGLLALRGFVAGRAGLELMRAFANHLALALERSQLREQALRAALLEEVDRLRRSLVGAVSHDLRTPLATIKVSTSTLLDPEADVSAEDARELLGLVDAQADRLDRLVANLLDMTRIQSGTLELRVRPVGVEELIDDAVASLGSSAELARLRREVEEGLPPVDADRVLASQVLANLIDNALRHTPEGSPVTVSARRRADRRVELAVSDRGPGVAPEERTSVFEMSNRREAGGRGGLGLAIVKAFVEAHGERVWVGAGEAGSGARFAFTLPVTADRLVPAAVPVRPG